MKPHTWDSSMRPSTLEKDLEDVVAIQAVALRRGNRIVGAFCLLVFVLVFAFFSRGAFAASGTVTFESYGTKVVSASSNSCADVKAGIVAYNAAQGYSSVAQSAWTCSSDPVVLGGYVFTQNSAMGGYGANWTVQAMTATAGSAGGGGGTTATTGSVDFAEAKQVGFLTFASIILLFCTAYGIGQVISMIPGR